MRNQRAGKLRSEFSSTQRSWGKRDCYEGERHAASAGPFVRDAWISLPTARPPRTVLKSHYPPRAVLRLAAIPRRDKSRMRAARSRRVRRARPLLDRSSAAALISAKWLKSAKRFSRNSRLIFPAAFESVFFKAPLPNQVELCRFEHFGLIELQKFLRDPDSEHDGIVRVHRHSHTGIE